MTSTDVITQIKPVIEIDVHSRSIKIERRFPSKKRRRMKWKKTYEILRNNILIPANPSPSLSTTSPSLFTTKTLPLLHMLDLIIITSIMENSNPNPTRYKIEHVHWKSALNKYIEQIH
jgi:hypothetical protein